MPRITAFSARLKEALATRKMTQKELCDLTGIPKSAMSQYVNGAFEPKQDRLEILAKALRVNEAWLMGYDDVPRDKPDINPEAEGGGAGAKYYEQFNTLEGMRQLDVENDTSPSISEERIKLVARHLDKIPEDKRERIIKNFEDTINDYLEALGLDKEE